MYDIVVSIYGNYVNIDIGGMKNVGLGDINGVDPTNYTGDRTAHSAIDKNYGVTCLVFKYPKGSLDGAAMIQADPTQLSKKTSLPFASSTTPFGKAAALLRIGGAKTLGANAPTTFSWSANTLAKYCESIAIAAITRSNLDLDKGWVDLDNDF